MERRHLKLFIASTGIIIVIMSLLYINSSLSGDIYRGNFERTFHQAVISNEQTLALPYNSYYIAGVSMNRIYLGNRTDPFHMVIVQTPALDTHHVRLTIHPPVKIEHYKDFTLRVDSPFFFLMSGTMPGVFRGSLDNWKADYPVTEDEYFVEAVPVGANTLAMRSISAGSRGFELAKRWHDGNFRFNYDILEKQIDGIFCVSGMLHYSRKLEKLVYLYSYRNQFMLIDTNLNLLYRANTIDTFAHAPIKTASLRSGSVRMLASPPHMINRMSCVHNDYLFVNSHILGKNEDIQEFLNRAVIDVYDLANGKYTFSFHLPSRHGRQLTDVRIQNDRMVLLYGRYMVVLDFKNLFPE